MKTIQLIFVVLSTSFFNACNEKETTPIPVLQVDVSRQWKFDNIGMLVSGYSDGQWASTSFSQQEIDLFSSLDTADLAGTTPPNSVIPVSGSYNAPFPNPFSGVHRFNLNFSIGYSGQFVLKLVYVDSLANAVYKKAIKLQATALPAPNPARAVVDVVPVIPAGRFRLYYTLSSAADRHFYKCWGNVQNQ